MLKTCRKGLHQYLPGAGCLECARATQKKRTQDPAVRAKIAAYVRQRRHTDPLFKARAQACSNASHKKRLANDPEFAERQSAYFREYHARRQATDPEYAERRRENTRRRRADPDLYEREREKARISDRARNETLEHQEYKRSYMKARFQRPETKDLHRANIHRRRSRLAGSDSPGVSPHEWAAICARHINASGETVCFYCRSGGAITIDHIVPIARGGRDEASNVIPACKRCNAGKRDRLVHEWHRARRLLGPTNYERLVAYSVSYV